MKPIIQAIKAHKKAAVLTLTVLLLFTCGSVISAVHVAQVRSEDAASQSAAANDAKEKADTEESDASLSDEQKKLIEDYDDDTEKFIQTLSASVWTASGGNCSLRFSDTSYTETVNGKVDKHPYAIARLDKGTDTSGAEVDSAVFVTDTGTHIVSYMNLKGNSNGGDGKVSSSLSSTSMFALGDTAYERTDAVESITIKGLNSEVTTLFGGDEKAIAKALSGWCAVHYPSVTEATWQKQVVLDYKNGEITTDFSLNDTNPIPVTMVYKQDTGEFSFSN